MERAVMKLSAGAEERYRKQVYGERRSIAGVEVVELRRFGDDSGALTELARLAGGGLLALPGFTVAQINDSLLAPGAVKAFHLHRRQTDVWYVPPEDRVLLVLVDVREGSGSEGVVMRTVLGAGHSRLVRIPPGIAHGCRNLGGSPARILYFTDLHFSPDPEETDEGRLPWDFLGAEVWEPVRD